MYENRDLSLWNVWEQPTKISHSVSRVVSQPLKPPTTLVDLLYESTIMRMLDQLSVISLP